MKILKEKEKESISDSVQLTEKRKFKDNYGIMYLFMSGAIRNDIFSKGLFAGLYTALAIFGGYIVDTFTSLFSYLGNGIAAVSKLLWRISDRFRHYMGAFLKKITIFLLRPVMAVIRYYETNAKELKRKKLKNGGRLGIKGFFSFAGTILFGKNGIAIMIFNCAIPIISVFFLFSVITYASSLNYAVKLNVNGKFLGYIETEQVFLDAMEVLQNRVNYLGSDLEIEATPSYSVEQIGYTETLTKYQIADLILQNSGVEIEYGYGFFINDVFYGALMDFSNVKNTLDRLLAENQTNNDTETIGFVDEIRYDEAGLYRSDSIIDEEWLIDLLTSTKEESAYYTVEDGDSHSLIADKVDLTSSELEALNPGFSEMSLHGGDLIKISNEVPFLSISITRTEVYKVGNVPYPTETYQDDNIYEGSSRRMQDGEYGENEITADVTYVNGVETGRNITRIEQLVAPVTEIIAIGTKPTPAGTYKGGTAALGKFLWPVDGGYVSQWSYWDGGYSGHKGVDIAGLYYGQPVYAGAAGVVTYAGYSQGLGYYVTIYHEDLGVSSTYGHNSTLYVSTGQRVAQGECIAGAGSTGISTGIHVHFGIQVNGTSVNPKAYLDIPPGTRENLA